MTITIENNSDVVFGFNYEAVIKDVIAAVLNYAGCPFESEVFVEFTDNKRIKEINREFRNMDKPTDVLSFPLIEYAYPCDFSDFDENDDLFNPDTGELMLGDIIISAERAECQANEYNHSLKREIAFLTAHSMLHLLGCDHMEQDEREQMEKMQDDILDGLGINR